MHALPSTIQPTQLHLAMWDYWTVEAYQEIFSVLVCIALGCDNSSQQFDCTINNGISSLGTLDAEHLRRRNIIDGTYYNLMPTLLLFNEEIQSSMLLSTCIFCQTFGNIIRSCKKPANLINRVQGFTFSQTGHRNHFWWGCTVCWGASRFIGETFHHMVDWLWMARWKWCNMYQGWNAGFYEPGTIRYLPSHSCHMKNLRCLINHIPKLSNSDLAMRCSSPLTSY